MIDRRRSCPHCHAERCATKERKVIDLFTRLERVDAIVAEAARIDASLAARRARRLRASKPARKGHVTRLKAQIARDPLINAQVRF